MIERDTHDGMVVEEFVTSTTHLYDKRNGSWMHDSDPSFGDYTGVFWFQYRDGKCTRRYTEKTAPKWLLALFRDAISSSSHAR